MSNEELLITENSEMRDLSPNVSYDAESNGTGHGTYNQASGLEELATDDEANPHTDSRPDQTEFGISVELLPNPNQEPVTFENEEQAPEVIYLSESGDNDHPTSPAEPHEIDVIELDSEEEIENLEESEFAPETVMSQSPGTGLDADDSSQHTLKGNEREVGINVDELSDSEDEDIEIHEYNSDIEDGLIINDATSNSPTGVSGVPIFINVRGDEFLLVPFYEECEYNLEDLISLFTVDEISDCTLREFFELLRGNGDLIDAYNFDVEDELCLSIPEMSISISEDNVHTGSLRLNDLIEPFISLIRQETNDPENIPDKMTVLVSMQPRFSTNFRKIVEAVANGKGYSHMFQSQPRAEEDTDEASRKRRRTSS